MTIAGGIDWNEAYRPLKKVSFVGVTLMNLYIVIGFFTILNVITGVPLDVGSLEGEDEINDIYVVPVCFLSCFVFCGVWNGTVWHHPGS